MYVNSRSSHLLALVLECCCLSCSLYKEVSSCGQQLISLLFCQLMTCHKKEQVIVGRLPPTKSTPTLEMGANGWCGIFLERFRKIRKLLNPELLPEVFHVLPIYFPVGSRFFVHL